MSEFYCVYKKMRKHYFGLYILWPQSIWFLHFGSSQLGLRCFQLALNLVPIVNSLTEKCLHDKLFVQLACIILKY